jgi:hypothetical protein
LCGSTPPLRGQSAYNCAPAAKSLRPRRQPVHYLYASKRGVSRKLVATFDSEAQLLAYVGWATLKSNADGTAKFEQGSALAGYQRWEKSQTALTEEDATQVSHNPTPNML